MSVECSDPVLSTGYPKVHAELYIEVLAGVSTSSATLEVMPPCFGASQIVTLAVGETKELVCPEYNQYYWTVKYIEYYSYYAARILICKELSAAPPPEEPPADDSTGLFDWLLNSISTVIYDVRNGVLNAIGGISTHIDGVQMSLIEVLGSIDTIKDNIIADSLTHFNQIKGSIEGLDIPSIESITGVLDLLTFRIEILKGEIVDTTSDLLNPIKTKIDAIDIPTVDSIKEGFLSLTVEFAEGLWDRILDKIEERYNK